MNLDHYHRLFAGESLVFPLSLRALWRLTGPDAERYLNGQVTNDIPTLREGHSEYAAVCTAKGRMEGDVSIARHAGDFFLDAEADLRGSLGARLDKFLIADDALFEDVSEGWSLTHVFGKTLPTAPEGGFVAAYARFGLPGHDVWTPGTDDAVAGEVVEADVIEALRIEHAIPRWGLELTPNTLPPEAGPRMLAAISYTKGCYVGQETIARLKSVGHVNRTLVFLRSETDSFPARETKLTLGEKEVGAVTSSAFSPRLGNGIALGYVQRASAAEGTVLETGALRLTISAPLANVANP